MSMSCTYTVGEITCSFTLEKGEGLIISYTIDNSDNVIDFKTIKIYSDSSFTGGFTRIESEGVLRKIVFTNF